MLKLGEHELPEFGPLSAAFGARLEDYPPMTSIPEDYQKNRAAGCRIASALFFDGGSLADHGRRLKEGVDSSAFHMALRAMLCSFAPKHEHKEAACGWLIDTYTDPA